MATLLFDIETVGENYGDMDALTKEELTKKIPFKKGTTEYKESLKKMKEELVFSPLTGRIVSIGVLDVEKDKAVVYYQAPGEELEDVVEGTVTYKQMTEEQMLESFWGGAARYDTFVTWNGRSFDVPYLIVRSAAHRIPVSKDLMSNRYVSSQRYGAKHIDLFDQVAFYGAVRRPGSLHMWCRALGIETPKDGAVAASNVGKAFENKEYLKIAQYNAKDLVATKELYLMWKQYFLAS